MDLNGLILPKFDILDSHARSVRELTKPLQQFGITSFSHTRIYKDNTFIDISDRSDMLDYFYYKTDLHKYYLPDLNPWAFKEKIFFCNTMENNPSIIGLREALDIDNNIVLFDHNEHHAELWHFASSCNNHNIVNFYLNNIDVLKAFTLFFKDAASAIIKDCEKHKIRRKIDSETVNIVSSMTNYYADKKCFYDNVALKQIIINVGNKQIKLSARESQILKWSLLGKSAYEISVITNISIRTVEQHIFNFKNKLMCNKVINIAHLFRDMNILDALLNLPG